VRELAQLIERALEGGVGSRELRIQRVQAGALGAVLR
jgi:hypothetical protein